MSLFPLLVVANPKVRCIVWSLAASREGLALSKAFKTRSGSSVPSADTFTLNGFFLPHSNRNQAREAWQFSRNQRATSSDSDDPENRESGESSRPRPGQQAASYLTAMKGDARRDLANAWLRRNRRHTGQPLKQQGKAVAFTKGTVRSTDKYKYLVQYKITPPFSIKSRS